MNSLEKLYEKKAQLGHSVQNLTDGLRAAIEKIQEYNKAIAEQADGKNEYDPKWLQIGLKQHKANKESIEQVMEFEYFKLEQCKRDIKAATTILNAHGACPTLLLTGDHDWEIVEIFPMSGNPKAWRCTTCPAKQHLGHRS